MKNLGLIIALLFLVTACVPKQAQLIYNQAPPIQYDNMNAEIPQVAQAYHSISLHSLINKKIIGSDFTIGQVLADNEDYTRYYITYKSGDLKISGIMNVPKGQAPFPLLVLNHGHIDPAIYTNGRGLKREQDYLAQRGYVVVHPDYRGHADSDNIETTEDWLRLGYTEDVIAAVKAIQVAKLDYIDTNRVGMLGHSMGGGVTMNVMVVEPDLIDAVVLFAPVSADYRRNFDKWIKSRTEVAERIEEEYGTPADNPVFWDGISANNYFDRVTVPVMNHHGTIDESVPLEWSDELKGWLDEAGIENTYYIYDGEPHEFTQAWSQVMARTVGFFDQQLKP